MRATATDLVVWDREAAEPGALAFRNPTTGEVVTAEDAAAVAAWLVAVREWQDAVVDEAVRLASGILNAHLDHIGATRTQLEASDGHVYEIAGETLRAADTAIAVAEPAELRADLDVLVERGLLSREAADGACRVETTVSYKTHVTKLRTLMGRGDAVAEAVKLHVKERPRPRRRPTVKRVS